MIIFDTNNSRGNYSPPRRNRRRHHSGNMLNDYIIENFIADWQKQKEEAAKKNEKKPDKKEGINTAGLGMLLFLLTPVIGPLYVYFTISMLHSSLEILKKLPIQ